MKAGPPDTRCNEAILPVLSILYSPNLFFAFFMVRFFNMGYPIGWFYNDKDEKMAIKTLEFEDLHQRWKLQKTAFDSFNLLVGLSGVGKTRTLRVLESIGRAARGDANHGFRHCKWTVEVDTAKGLFFWSARTVPDEVTANEDDPDDNIIRISPIENIRFVFEEVRTAKGDVIVHRDEESLSLLGEKYPRLRSTDSIISLLEEEPISTIREALSAIHYSRTQTERQPRPFEREKLEKLIAETLSVDALKQNRSLDLISKAYVLKERFPEQFDWVKEQMMEIFGTIAELDIGPRRSFSTVPTSGPFDLLVPAFKERGVDGWIHGGNMSSGMLRTLMHLLELHLEPPGSVLLIDEYENGMGVNCLPQVTELILERSSELQLIFTSHHPFVINEISKQFWLVMQREGHEVQVKRYADIERLNTKSNQDAFIQLINAPEYVNGLQ
jgi:predicted ATPase